MNRPVPQRVQVFALGKPRPAGPRRFYVKWRIDGRDRTRSFKTRGEADRFRSQLLAAVQAGERFNRVEGLPESWSPAATGDGPTWWTWCRDWLALKWQQWSGHTRRSGVETVALFTPLLLRPGAPAPPADLRAWLRSEGLRSQAGHDYANWLTKWSRPLRDIDASSLESALRVGLVRADGVPMAATVARRHRNLVASILQAAVRRDLLPTNPMDKVEWRTPARSLELDISTVPTPADIEAAVDVAWNLTTGGERYAALFATVGMAGLRPSEVAGLHLTDLELPKSGWGLARARVALTSPGSRFTVDGAPVERKGLKHRATNVVREVPLPPRLVELLRAHVERFPARQDLLFSNGGGRPVTAGNYGPVWGRVRAQLWPALHPLAGTTVYDLRHAAATMMLRAGVPAAEVARRLGHSVDVLLRVYAGVFDGERERSNALIDAALNGGS